MTWSDYYNRFYDWSESTQVSRISSINDFSGASAEEIVEVCYDLCDELSASRLVRRAIKHGVRFNASEVCELADCVRQDVLVEAVNTVEGAFTWEELDELSYSLPAEVYRKLEDATDPPVEEDVLPDYTYRETIWETNLSGTDAQNEYADTQNHSGNAGCLVAGILGLLFLPFKVIFSLAGEKSGSNNSHYCNGDCANCPPHYGYRYGRWYYGHGHMRGCQRGGNGGASGRCYRD